jgi:tellurite resistance protein TerC
MLLWIGFLVLIALFLALDLGVFNKEAHVVSTREALGWTTLWVSMSLLFGLFIYFAYDNHWFGIGETVGQDLGGRKAVLKYLTGYLVEQSLSVDNIFVIAMIFTYFRVPPQYQHRVLFWGIVGAVLFRGIMIFAGVALIERFHWISYVFGGILLFSAYKMLTSHGEEVHPEKNPLVNFFKRLMPVSNQMEGEKFFVQENGVRMATPLLICLIVVETTDVMFAFDSIPAIFAITTDPFLVFSSNIFAILGLRSLYFVLASILDRFKYLQYSLVIILAFVGVKMILLHHVELPEWLSLVVIVGLLGGGVLLSIIQDRRNRKREAL